MENVMIATNPLIDVAGNEEAFENIRHDVNNQEIFGTCITCFSPFS